MQQQDMTNNVNFILFKIAILTISSAEGIFIDADAAGRDYIKFLSSMDSEVREKYMANVAKRYETKECGKFMGRDYDMQEIIAFDAVKLFKAKQNHHPYFMSKDGEFIVSENHVRKVKKKRPQLGKDGKPVIELAPEDVIILKPGEKLNEDGEVVVEGQIRPRKKRPQEEQRVREVRPHKIRRPIVEEEIIKKEPIIKRPRDEFEPRLRPILSKEKILQRNAQNRPKPNVAAEEQRQPKPQQKRTVVKKPNEERKTTPSTPREDTSNNVQPRQKPTVDRTERERREQRIVIKSEIIIKPTSKNGIRADILSKIGTPGQRTQSVFQKTVEKKTMPIREGQSTVMVNVRETSNRPIINEQTRIVKTSQMGRESQNRIIGQTTRNEQTIRPTSPRTAGTMSQQERIKLQREQLTRRREEILKRREAQRREFEIRAAARAERLVKMERARVEARRTITSRPISQRPSSMHQSMDRLAREQYISQRVRPRPAQMSGVNSSTRNIIEKTIAQRREEARRRLEMIEKRRATLKQQAKFNPHISYEIHIG